MSAARDPITSIPVHASTLKLLQRMKTGGQNWDEFLLTFLEDWMPPNLEAELDKRAARSTVVPASVVLRRSEERRRRGR